MAGAQMIASACFLFISLAAMKAIFNDGFRDSVIQRIGLAGVSIFSLGLAYNSHLYGSTPVLEMYAIGQATFTFGSLIKR